MQRETHPIDPERFAELIAQLTGATGRVFSGEDIACWYGLLSDLPGEAVERGMQRLARDAKDQFLTVAMVRERAVAADLGQPDQYADAYARCCEARRRLGPCLPCVPRCDTCREDAARRYVGDVAWKAIRGLGGWSAFCSDESPQSTQRAQFRDAYRATEADERRDRALPEDLRPRIDNAAVRGIEAAAPAKSLPDPGMPAPRPAVLRVVHGMADPDPPAARPDDAEIERRKRAAENYLRTRIAREAAGGAG